MRQKLFALFAATAMAATMVSVPMSAQAADSNTNEFTVFESGNETQWYLHQNADGSGSAYITEESSTSATGIIGTGNSVTLKIAEGYSNTVPVQVRPIINDNKYATIAIESGATYTISVDYEADITRYTHKTPQNIVYMRLSPINLTGFSNYRDECVLNHKAGDTDDLTTESTLSYTFTAQSDGTLSVQLYLRHAVGSVTFDNLKITKDGVASITSDNTTTYYDTLESAFTAAGDKDTITLLRDAHTGRLLLNDNGKGSDIDTLTIDGNDHSIIGNANNNCVLEINNSKTLNLKNTTVTGGKDYTINAASGRLNLSNVTVGAVDSAIPGIRGNGGDTDAEGSTIYSYLWNNVLSQIDLDESSYLNGTITLAGNAVGITKETTLITGTPDNCTAGLDNDAFAIENGVISPATAEPDEGITATTEYVGSYMGDEDETTAAAWTVTFSSNYANSTSSFNTANITWTLGDNTLNLTEGSSNPTTVTLNGGNALFGVIVNGVYYNDSSNAETLSATVNLD
ncbi:MAG TPA: hypothetical protein IAA61_11190 [Candidatus Ornithomonoglobus merdipullorum]|uniref:Uncharacterized protein n=1 Tax=Candidatus Ornithomonoglobus merdipullorum TaxID=2840895 RepID=A0A9D1SG45_9FIRM|nr:hypothetical protein [Candidatus Ornithomonoglobus merdipullorum]